MAQLQLLYQAIDRHVRRTGGFPPAYIVDAQGQPLLSWRVALLADLGGQDLLKLFHLDEPWDSAHNQTLLKHMPAFFAASQRNVPADHTTLLAFRSEDSVLADGVALSARQLRDAPDTIVLFG